MTTTTNPFQPKVDVNPSASKKRWFLKRQGLTVSVLVNLGGNDGIDKETLIGTVSHVELGGFMGAQTFLTLPSGTTVSFPLAAVLDVADGDVTADQKQDQSPPADDDADADATF